MIAPVISDVPAGADVTPGADGLTILHVGCGRRKTMAACGFELKNGDDDYAGPVRWINLDGMASVEPDIVCQLGDDAIPMDDNSVDIALAHHVIEHVGVQGEIKQWFYFWAELYRVLKPNGRVLFECPYHTSLWAWADPTHVRPISEYTFLYLNQDAYRCGGSIPDYRPACDFVLSDWRLRPDTMNPDVMAKESASHMNGVLTARKPFRPYWVGSCPA